MTSDKYARVRACMRRAHSHLDVSLGSDVVVPQDDLAVFSSSAQQGAASHLAQAEHAALVTFHLTADLKRCAIKEDKLRCQKLVGPQQKQSKLKSKAARLFFLSVPFWAFFCQK